MIAEYAFYKQILLKDTIHGIFFHMFSNIYYQECCHASNTFLNYLCKCKFKLLSKNMVNISKSMINSKCR